MISQRISIKTPEILWHGGNDNGKTSPVYSIDTLPLVTSTESIILVTSGTDGKTPPQGSARIWRLESGKDVPECLVDLNDHQSVVNVARFSPCGKMLATASDRMIVIYKVSSPSEWYDVREEKQVQRSWLRPHLQEIYDLKWSPDSSHIIAGSIDCKAEALRVLGSSKINDSIALTGHSSFVQGVAWDPLNQILLTQSADRSCRTYQIKTRGAGGSIKLCPKGNNVIKTTPLPSTTSSHSIAENSAAEKTTEVGSGDGAAQTNQQSLRGTYLFADDTVNCFFRRPDFSPDGAYFICPSGLYKPLAATPELTQSFCCHVFSRHQLTTPVASLAGLDEPPVAVRFSSVVYRRINVLPSEAEACSDPASAHAEETVEKDVKSSYLHGDLRFLFAVVTTSSIFVYDTQHTHPILRITGCHFATINDASWGPDGGSLLCCSSDGYVTIIRFDAGVLGYAVDPEDVPISIKKSHRCQYGLADEEIATCQSPTSEKPDFATNDAARNATELRASVTPPGRLESSEEQTELTNVQKDENSESSSAKKRRRIMPTPISGLVDPASLVSEAFRDSKILTTLSTAKTESVHCDEPMTTERMIEQLPNMVTSEKGEKVEDKVSFQLDVQPKKTKKRIAPMLVVS